MKAHIVSVDLEGEYETLAELSTIDEALYYLQEVEYINNITVVVTFVEQGTIHSASLDDLDTWQEEMSAVDFIEDCVY